MKRHIVRAFEKLESFTFRNALETRVTDLPTGYLAGGVVVLVLVACGSTGAPTSLANLLPVNPFSGQSLYVDPAGPAGEQVEAWRDSRPDDAEELEKIARNPQADWFGDWNDDVRASVARRVREIRGAGALPVLVAYNIPLRDCGSYSAGGASSPDDYRSWIRDFAAGVGGGAALVVLEPDAVAGSDCLSEADRDTRLSLIRDAVSVLSSAGDVHVYIDAGHARWKSAAEIARLLESAGIDRAAGFALNVSNTIGTEENVQYGTAVSERIGGKHFLIDTSRNGLGPTANSEWCNPPGRALGDAPTLTPEHERVDALLWIKRPGESDGTCNGGPRAGAWWADYALGLAVRAPDDYSTAGTVAIASDD